MAEKILDGIGVVCWVLMFIGPVIIAILTFRFVEGSILTKIILALVLGFVCFVFLYMTSLAIIFRHGLGPG